MRRLNLLIVMAFLLTGCDELAAQKAESDRAARAKSETPDAVIQRVEIERMSFDEGVTVIHDDRRQVTCWVYRAKEGGYSITGGGISCVPDQLLSVKGVAQ